VTGAGIADQMDISSSSFHNHLRAAQRRLLESIIGQHHVGSTQKLD